MKITTNPNVDLNKNSSLYFVIGLCLVLFLTWKLLEWKTFEKDFSLTEALAVEQEDIEEIPITEQIKAPPPPAAAPAPVIIEVVEDESEVEETVIESTETDEEEEIVDVEEVEIEEEEEEINVPFSIIEDVPIFPGCEKVDKSKRRDCFQEKMNSHIRKTFRYPEITQEMGIQGKVYVNFVIGKDGVISEIRMRGPDKNLEKEAERIISKLPQMTPGKQRGKPVRVPFSIPINFLLQ